MEYTLQDFEFRPSLSHPAIMIAHTKPEVIKNWHEQAKKNPEEVFKALQSKTQNIAVLPPSHPRFPLIEEAVNEYNQEHRPIPPLTMPNYIVSYPKGGGYLQTLDVLAVGEDTIKLSPEEFKAYISHELGHKEQFRKPQEFARFINISALVDEKIPDFWKEAQNAGLTQEEARSLLPYTPWDHAFSEGKNNPNQTIELGNLNKKLAEIKQDRAAASVKITGTKLDKNLDQFWAEYRSLGSMAENEFQQALYRQEYGADSAAPAKKELLSGLVRTAGLANADSFHPAVIDRIKAQGCSYIGEVNSVDPIACPTTPAIPNGGSRGKAQNPIGH